MSVVSSAEKTIGWVSSTRPVPDGLAVVVQRDVAALGEAAAVVGELHPHLVRPRPGWARSPRWRTRGCRGRCRRTSPGRPWRRALHPPNRPPWAMITPSAPPSGTSTLGGDRERLVLDADDAVLRQPAHAGEEQLGVPSDQRRSPGDVGVRAARRPGRRAGSTLYLVASMSHSRCSSCELLGLLRRQVVRLADQSVLPS